MHTRINTSLAVASAFVFLLTGCGQTEESSPASAASSATNTSANALTDAQINDIVRASYQYVAMYNVNNKFGQRGWNSCVADTRLKDHTMRDIARPNNDTLYVSCMLDLRKDPVILDIPAIDSKYVSLMVTGYDHYVNVPLSVSKGDFSRPEKVLFYTQRTEGYSGGPVEGVDRSFEMTGDFDSAVFRVMPHANDAARFAQIVEAMSSIRAITLSELQGRQATAIDDVAFPDVGQTDLDVYEDNFREVMQFVANHTTFDADDELDREFLAAMRQIGVEPGRTFDANGNRVEGARWRAAAEEVRRTYFARAVDPATAFLLSDLFQPKGQMTRDLLVLQSVIGPIGLPAQEAVYPPVATTDGQPMNAQNDYVIRMSSDQLPPARAFWSLTLYDSANGFFIPNDSNKYSVGENAGMRLNDDGGIDVYVAAQRPEGVPAENWLPINRQDEDLDIILRIYLPDLERLATYQAPRAQRLE